MRPIYLEYLEAQPLSERAGYILGHPESQWFERKGVDIEPKDITRPIIAFANAEGGMLIIGASNGVAMGLSKRPRLENAIYKAIHDQIKPAVKLSIDKIEVINTLGEPDRLLVITVNSSDIVHEDNRGRCYLRVGDDSRELKYNQRQELEYTKGVRDYDGECIVGSNLDDLEADLVAEYAAKVGYSGQYPVEALRARFLIDKDNQQTNACHLLFSRHPHDIFPQASIRITKMLSDERGVGASLMIDGDHDYRLDGNIPTLIRRSTEIIDTIITKRKALGVNGEFIFHDIIPRDAWLEGVVNALIHRSYSLSGDYVRVEIYPSRVEITSPGGFPSMVSTKNLMTVNRFARNPRIARVCTELGFGQELGEGIKRMVTEMRKLGYIDPVYVQSGSSVQLRLEAMMRLSDELSLELPKRSEEVLNIIRMHPGGIGTGDIMNALHMTRPTVSLRLRKLEEVGLIVRHGKSATDPRAMWAVNE